MHSRVQEVKFQLANTVVIHFSFYTALYDNRLTLSVVRTAHVDWTEGMLSGTKQEFPR